MQAVVVVPVAFSTAIWNVRLNTERNQECDTGLIQKGNLL